MPNPILNASNPVLQSDQLYLQAVGSQGNDSSKTGNHLRWDLVGGLENNFAVQANPTKVYRAIYENTYKTIVDFASQPDSIVINNDQRLWIYDINVALPQSPGNITSVVIRFLDINQFDQLTAQLGNGYSPVDFLNNYDGVFKIWTPEKLFFEFGFEFINKDRREVRTEAISRSPEQHLNTRFLSFRGVLDTPDPESNDFTKTRVEYIDFIRCLRGAETQISKLVIVTYKDTLQGEYEWELIDEAFLSSGGNSRIGSEQWRKFNRYNMAGNNSYEPIISMTNYHDRWGNQGLQEAVADFLSGNLSSPPESIANDGNLNSEPASFLYADLFKVAAADYHIARMLGLGYIDENAQNREYLYMIQYNEQFSLSLPTTKNDSRYPQSPEIELGYGIQPNTGECNPSIDGDGYAKFENARYINLRREAFYYEKNIPPFYESNEAYIFYTAAVQYGVRHQRKTVTNIINSELSIVESLQDDTYSDAGGQREEIGILDNGEFSSPIFVHRATETKYHHYSLYSINWFSRTHEVYDDSLSNLVLSDETIFQNECGIVYPPTDASAQVIFKEISPILTTQTEQNMLNPDASNLVVRVKYKWQPPAEISGGGAEALPFIIPNQVEFYFREVEANLVHGIINEVEDLPCGKCLLTLTISNGTSIGSSFVGSVIVVNEMPYVVTSINGSQLEINGIPNNGIISPSNSNASFISTEYIKPKGGDLFVLSENLTEPSAWTKLDHVEPLGSSSTQGTTQTGSVTQVPHSSGSGNTGVYYIVINGGSNTGNTFGGYLEIEGQVYNVVDSLYNGSQLRLTVVDGEFDESSYTVWDSSLTVTYFSGVKLYLDETSGLEYSVLYPSGNDISKITYLGLRAVDSVTGCGSSITPLIPMVAVGYQEPVQPIVTPLLEYATRPDFYGKSSYTFQVGFPETPYALVFYRADGKNILENIYTAATLNDILANNSLEFVIENLSILVNGDIANSQLPAPDNIGSGSVQDAIKISVNSSFVPLSKEPIIYDKINSSLASPKPPSASNRYPMVVKVGGDLQFTDFTLDGANNSVVFYCGVGMNNRLEMSAPSDIVGPIRLINSYPPKPVGIKKVITKLPNQVQGIPVAVEFEVNPYVESENIQQYKIYRTEEAVKALSIHSMDLVKTIPSNEILQDDFSGSDFVPYGEPLFYRVVALREIVNESNESEFVPSFPSELAIASVADFDNPSAAILSFTGNEILNGNNEVEEIQDVVLSWDKTVHNGKYFLFKMNNYGNWQKIYEEESNDASISVSLIDTTLGSGSLSKLGASGNIIYHHFKVTVENSSGLLSLDEQRLTI